MKKLLFSCAVISLTLFACDKDDELTTTTPSEFTTPKDTLNPKEIDTTTIPKDTIKPIIGCNGTKIYEGTAKLNTQAEVDAFIAEGWTEVSKELRIENAVTDISKLTCITKVETLTIHSDNITDLTGLDNLSSLSYLNIYSANELTSLKGLENVTTENASISIEKNAKLTSLAALSKMNVGEFPLNISDNKVLPNLVGLEGITTVGNTFEIKNNEGLTSLKGLDNLASLTFGTPAIVNNNALLSLEGLEGLTTIKSLTINDNDALANLKGLDNLTEVTRDLSITKNIGLTTVTGLNKLTKVANTFTFRDNQALTKITGFNSLTTVGRFLINENRKLSDVSGFQKIAEITTAVNFSYLLVSDFCFLKQAVNDYKGTLATYAFITKTGSGLKTDITQNELKALICN